MIEGDKTGLVLDHSLAEYLTATEHFGHADYAKRVQQFHEMSGAAMRERENGHVNMAIGYEAEANQVAVIVEKYEADNGTEKPQEIDWTAKAQMAIDLVRSSDPHELAVMEKCLKWAFEHGRQRSTST